VTSSEEDKENIVPSESEVLQTTINRLQSDLQELRTSVAEKDIEISRLSVQNKEAENQIQSLVSMTAIILTKLKILSVNYAVCKMFYILHSGRLEQTSSAFSMPTRIKERNVISIKLI
jgi:hypothetical protein